MITYDSATQTVLASPHLAIADMVEVRVRRRSDNSEVREFIWSGAETITQRVRDPFTGAIREESWDGMGQLISVGDFDAVSNISVTSFTVRLSNVSDDVDELFRTYEAKYGTAIFYRSFWNPKTGLFAAPGISEFVGTIENIAVTDAIDDEYGYVEIEIRSIYHELTRSSPAIISDQWQRVRDPNDELVLHSASLADRTAFWGRASDGCPSSDIPRARA